jgi:hypothetical protein
MTRTLRKSWNSLQFKCDNWLTEGSTHRDFSDIDILRVIFTPWLILYTAS